MKKTFLLILAITGHCIVNAQTNAAVSASQTAILSLGTVVQISAFGGGSGNTSTVTMPISASNDLASGIESPEFTLAINSTAGFDVKAKANTEYFSYTGTATFPPSMRVSDVLALKVSNNSTSATITGGHEQYQPLSGSTESPILVNGAGGSNQVLGVKYKSTPGYNYPAGVYTVDIVYTITQY
jgi:hypothetical protein